MTAYDVAIIGGGIVGLSTAFKLSEMYPALKSVVIEKESAPGSHQSSRNSGVLHSGVYYKPGSLKAENCIRGKKLLHEFCDKHSIQYKVCGKLIVASRPSERGELEKLYKRGLDHGIQCRLIESESGLRDIEPYLKGCAGIHVASTSVIKFSDVVNKLSELLCASGKDIRLNSKVERIKAGEKEHLIYTSSGEITAKVLVNTAGLFSDKIAQMGLDSVPLRIIPFRGEYYELKEHAKKYCNALIYPVPNPEYPFLGVHITRMIDGNVECGPNAVLALAREGYSWKHFSSKELAETLLYPGFVKLAFKHGGTGIYEVLRSLNKRMFLSSVQNLIPDIREEDITPGGSGVRAQAVSSDGKLVDDFYFVEKKNQLHVLNAPSPAATSCLSIGESIVTKLATAAPDIF